MVINYLEVLKNHLNVINLFYLSLLNPEILDILIIQFGKFHSNMINSYIIKTHKWFPPVPPHNIQFVTVE